MATESIILASASPRRKELMLGLGFEIEVIPADVDESFPSDMPLVRVPEYLAELKAHKLAEQFPERLVVAADTVVIIENTILNKPKDASDAKEMLVQLSGKMHQVITGVSVHRGLEREIFSDVTEVYFKELNDYQLDYYISKYKPFDKAGAYGVQEWIGYVAVEKIVGSFYNVMGLPVSRVYDTLLRFLK